MNLLIASGAGGGAGPIPPPPTRAELLAGVCRLQGVTIRTAQYGEFRAFGPEINMLDLPDDRRAYYDAQRFAGTTVLCIGWAGDTYVSGGFTYPVPGPRMRWVDDIPGFCDRLAEIIEVGRFRGGVITLPGDGLTGVDGNRYGNHFVFVYAPRLLDAMKTYRFDLTEYFFLSPGFDGVVWVWPPEQIVEFGYHLRDHGARYLALEYPAGVLGPFGEGKSQYTTGGMDIYDLFLQEFAYPLESNWDQLWQIGARMLGPAYRRGVNQPPDDDPGAPFGAHSPNFYLSEGTPRGPYATWGWEYDTYGWVRGAPLDQVEWHRRAIADCGYPSVG